MNRRLRHRRGWQRRQSRRSIQGALTPPSPETTPDWQTFEADLQQLELAVQAIRQRFEQIRQIQQQQQTLQQHLQAPDLTPEQLHRLQQQLEALETQLAAALFDWRSLQEPFWQAVRFGGLGIVIGWMLKTIASS